MSHLVKLRDGRVMPMDSEEFQEYLDEIEATRPPLTAAQHAQLYPLLEPMRTALRELAEKRLASA